MSEIEDVVVAITYAHRDRCYYMDVRKILDLKLGSILRGGLGWRKCASSEKEQLAINEQARERAAALVEIGEAEVILAALVDAAHAAAGRKLTDDEIPDHLKGQDKVRYRRNKEKRLAAEADEAYARWRKLIMTSIKNRAAFADEEAAAADLMRQLAASLPVYPWWCENVFEDALQLAVIVGEAGDLSKYPEATYPDELPSGDPHPKAGQPRKLSSGPSCLWKRMGVAVIGAGDGSDDKRQGGLSKSASAEEWMDHGYSRKRRSRLFVIGDVMVKQAIEPYRTIYLGRKEFERKKAEAKGLTVAPAASIPKKRQHEFMSVGHIDKRARRYIEKRLLKDLWKAWRRAKVVMAERPKPALPAASPTEQRWLQAG